MKGLNWFEKIIDWILTKLEKYDCEKGRHRWGYTLSETGRIYLNDKQVPKDKLKCLDCGKKKY
jgi:hypothetical protein